MASASSSRRSMRHLTTSSSSSSSCNYISAFTTNDQSTPSSEVDKPDDFICSLLKAAIDEYRLSSFHTFDLQVYVRPASHVAEIHDTWGQPIGHDKYVFQVWSHPDKTMAVRLNSIDGALVVRFGDRWTYFSEFLKLLKPPIDWNADNDGFSASVNKQYRWQHQARWWQANCKRFPLLVLPAEIRNLIYGYAVGGSIEPYPTHNARHLGQNADFMLVRMANTSLLHVSRLVYKEVSDVIFTFTAFLIEHKHVAARLLKNPTPRSRIRQLEMALSHEEFFRLFGGNFHRDGEIKGLSRTAERLRKMKLSKLHLKIAAPSILTASERLDGACQKIVVDWILEVAWPAVRGHPVEISGFLKTRQKTAFEAACKLDRQRFQVWQQQRVILGKSEGSLKHYDDWLAYIEDDEEEENRGEQEEGGVALIEVLEQETFKAGHVDITASKPVCVCELPCTVEDWTTED